MESNFYYNIEESEANKPLLSFLEEYAKNKHTQVYVINRALGSNYKYDYDDVAVVLIPNHKIMILNVSDNDRKFEDFCEDFIDDLGYISDKYDYKGTIGRKRDWVQIIVQENYKNINSYDKFIKDALIVVPELKRISQMLISLLVGSINDVSKVGKEVPADMLDFVKRRIILYDGMQTDFIFSKLDKKIIKIQGLAGTGKTELLLRKLKELYTDPDLKNCRIALTCHNKILAKNLKDRIPGFFDFLKVEEQIKWNDTLFVMSSWGSNHQKLSGVYSYICSTYQLVFLPYSYERSFDYVCQQAIEELKNKPSIEPCFDYMLIDESQDFPQSFFELCNLVTKHQIYIAGDVFQNIFDMSEKETNPDYLLNKCYRTDPKTLMFAHAMGMGILDSDSPSNYISWLSDEEWAMCGYEFSRQNNRFTFSRQALSRFDDINTDGITSMYLEKANFDNYEQKIINIIKELKKKYPNIMPDDIGIVFLDDDSANYKLVDRLESLIFSNFKWRINKGYESKSKIENMLFASNINNVKGLEFPFIICLSKNKLNANLRVRNAMYMVLTRSFISSYFIISDTNEGELINNINKNLVKILQDGELTVNEPSEQEKEQKRTAIISKANIKKSQKDIANELMDTLKIAGEDRAKIHKALKMFLEDENDCASIRDAIEAFVKIMR